MKRILYYTLLAMALTTAYAQEDSTKTTDPVNEMDVQVFDDGQDIDIIMEEVVKKDTTSIDLGSKKIEIIEDDDETSIKIYDDKEENDDEKSHEWDWDWDFDTDSGSKSKKFRGHWAGFEFGLNNYVNSDFKLSRTDEDEFMDLNTGKSWNFNFNFAQYSLGFNSKRTGMVIGMGIEWSNYHFSNANTIIKSDGEIIAQPIPHSIIKNRLQTTYLTFPVLYELQLFQGNRNDRMYFAVGAIGGIKLFSNTKIKYTENGSKKKNKERGDYYLTPLRYGVTARAGYKMVKVYFNYYLSPLFLDGRGPELYPVAAGLALTF